MDYRARVVNFGSGSRLDFLGGWRVASLNESLTLGTSSTGAVNDITSSEPALGLPPPANGSVANITNFSTVTSDTFSTKNLFTGPEVGVGGKYKWGAFSLSGDAKVALGANFEQLSVSGSTTSTTITSTTPTQVIALAGIPLTVPSGAPAVNTATTSRTPGGLFAQAQYSKTVFAVMPSAVLRFGYDVIPEVLTLGVGYTVFGLTSVVRPGNQANNINPGNLAQSTFWAQGATLGALYRF